MDVARKSLSGGSVYAGLMKELYAFLKDDGKEKFHYFYQGRVESSQNLVEDPHSPGLKLKLWGVGSSFYLRVACPEKDLRTNGIDEIR